jgi:hypothetical protein
MGRICRIGVVGHRVLAEPEKIRAGIDKALRRAVKYCGGQPVTVLSGLAEGADLLAAEAALAKPSVTLTAVLPLPRKRYVEDFRSARSRAEFERLMDQATDIITLPRQKSRPEAYAQLSDYLLKHCDVILAVWDGEPERGRGGTGATVRTAIDGGLPVAWVHAGNSVMKTERPMSLGTRQGRITYENF